MPLKIWAPSSRSQIQKARKTQLVYTHDYTIQEWIQTELRALQTIESKHEGGSD